MYLPITHKEKEKRGEKQTTKQVLSFNTRLAKPYVHINEK